MAGTKVQPTGKVIESVRLIYSDVKDNHNKVWFSTLYDSHDVKVEWGAVDTNLQWCTHVGAGRSKLEALKKSKLKKGYTEQRTIDGSSGSPSKAKTVAKASLRDVATQQIKHSNPYVAKLIAFLSDANIHAITSHTHITFDTNTGMFSTPYGIVEKSAISEARQLLTTIGDCVSVNDWESDGMMTAVGQFLRLIPQRVPRDNKRKRLDVRGLIPNVAAVQRQNDILDSLDASLQQALTTTPTDKKSTEEKVFDVQLDLVEDGKTIDKIRKKYRSDKGSHYDVATLDVKQVFAVQISTVHDAFEKHGRKVGNIKQLWHASKCSNLLSILKGGLIIPPASSSHVTGRMWYDGIYTSSCSSKALRYATNAWSQGGAVNRTFMFICNIALGKQYVPKDGESWGFRLPQGYDSCWAKPGFSGVLHDEQVVYKTNQVDLDFLVEFSPHGK